MDDRGLGQLDRFGDAAVIIRAPIGEGHVFVAVRRLVQDDAVDRLVMWIQHPDGKPMRRVRRHGRQRIGDIQCERRLAALMLPNVDPVDPHLSQVVDDTEAQQIASLGITWGFRGEGTRVPGNAVVTGERLLDDAGNRGSLGSREGKHRVPVLLPAHVVGVAG